MAIPSGPASALRATQRKNRIRKSPVVMTFQIKPPGRYVHVVLSLFDKWPWIFLEFWDLPRWKNLFLCFPLFFSSFYCVDFFISFVLRHLWVKQFFALRMSWGLQIVRKNAFHQSRTERNDNRAAPEMSACHNSGTNKNWSVVKLACTTGAL